MSSNEIAIAKIQSKLQNKQLNHQIMMELLKNPVTQMAIALALVELIYQYEKATNPYSHPLSDKMMAFSGWLVLANALSPYGKEIITSGSQIISSATTAVGNLAGKALDVAKGLGAVL